MIPTCCPDARACVRENVLVYSQGNWLLAVGSNQPTVSLSQMAVKVTSCPWCGAELPRKEEPHG